MYLNGYHLEMMGLTVVGEANMMVKDIGVMGNSHNVNTNNNISSRIMNAAKFVQHAYSRSSDKWCHMHSYHGKIKKRNNNNTSISDRRSGSDSSSSKYW